MKTFMQAIATEEGFYVEGSRAQRNANPGNLNFEPWLAEKYGAVLETIPRGYNESPRFACFKTAVDGWSAMQYLLLADYLGLTIETAIAKWAPASDGNADPAYVAAVCQMSGLTAGTVLTGQLLTD
jgi:hypothetical protein